MLQSKINAVINNLTNKEEKLSDILRLIVDYCKIDKTKYCIIGSYAIRSKRTINDLDVIMETSEWNKLRIATVGHTEIYNKQDRYFLDMTEIYQKAVDPEAKDFSIEIFSKKYDEGFPNNEFSIEYLTTHNGLQYDSNNHPYFSTRTLLKWKKTMDRPKNRNNILR